MTVAVIDYGSGNLRSCAKAFERAALDAGIDLAVVVTDDAAKVRNASHVVLPGVGAFGDCRAGLDALPGMVEALEDAVARQGKPFFGICVGMQLMATVGLEHGRHDGLGWIAGEVGALEPVDASLKIPHMGWNDIHVNVSDHPVLAGLVDGTHFYFVHSFAMRTADPAHVLAEVDYGGRVTALIGRDNLIGSQFHPEKSQAAGLKLIANFLRWRP